MSPGVPPPPAGTDGNRVLGGARSGLFPYRKFGMRRRDGAGGAVSGVDVLAHSGLIVTTTHSPAPTSFDFSVIFSFAPYYY